MKPEFQTGVGRQKGWQIRGSAQDLPSMQTRAAQWPRFRNGQGNHVQLAKPTGLCMKIAARDA